MLTNFIYNNKDPKRNKTMEKRYLYNKLELQIKIREIMMKIKKKKK